METSPKAIFSHLNKIAPDISFSVIWSIDRYFTWDGDGPDPLMEGYISHNVDVLASAIVAGEDLEGRGSIGGVYEKPNEEDPDIHGYLPQKIEGAVDELIGILPKRQGKLGKQLAGVKKYLKEVMHLRYEDGRRPGYHGGVLDWYPKRRRPTLGIGLPQKKFGSPTIVMTPGAEDAVSELEETKNLDIIPYLDRHFSGDWGEIGKEDASQNDAMVSEKGMILSSYTLPTGTKIWIITDPGHKITTILLPGEY